MRRSHFTISVVTVLLMTLGYFTGILLQLGSTNTGSVLPSIGSKIFGNRETCLTTRQRIQRSNELYADMIVSRNDFMRQVVPDYMESSGFTGANDIILWDWFPPAWNCPHEVTRVGHIGEGGKWLCGMDRIMSRDSCVVYSFGVGGDSSFEAAFLNRSAACKVWAYDYSVGMLGPEIRLNEDFNRRAFFYQYRLDIVDDEKLFVPPRKRTLAGLMKENGHTWIDVLKIDVEGSEFDVLNDLFMQHRKKPLPIGQLQLEIHAYNGNFAAWLKWWQLLEETGLRPFFREVNYFDSNRNVETKLVEYSFVNTYADYVLMDDSLL